MEGNENNVNMHENNNQNVKKIKEKSGKGMTIFLGIVVLILVLAIGICGGLIISGKGNTIINNIEEKVQEKEENKVSKKIEDSKDWVYDAEYGKDKEVKTFGIYKSNTDLVVPFININSNDGNKINKEIEDLYNEAYRVFGNSAGGDVKYIRELNYKTYINNNIMSVIIEHYYGIDRGDVGRSYITYNFNLDTLQLATLEETGKVCGFSSENEIKEKAKIAMKNAGSEEGIFEDTVWDEKRFFINQNGKLSIVLPGPALSELLLNVDVNEQVIKSKVVSVIDENKDSQETRNQMVVVGKASDGKVIWRYTTLASNIPEEKSNHGLNLIGVNNGKVYVCDWGKLYILDEQTGNVLYTNVNDNIGYASVNVFDKNNNLYTVSYPMILRKFDENGNLLGSTEELWNKGLYWPKSLKIENDVLIAEYQEGTAKVLLKDLSLVEINLTDNKLSTNGIVKKLSPNGWAGSSMQEIRLYDNGEVYQVTYNGEGNTEENISNSELIAKNADSIEEKLNNQVFEGIIVKGSNLNIVKQNVESWIIFE